MNKLLVPVVFFILLVSPVFAAEDAGVAKVNDVVIRTSELEAAVDQLIPRATYHGNVSDEKRDSFREKALTDLINKELEYQDAVANGIKPDKKQVKAEMSRIRDQYASKKIYKQALERSKITEDDLQKIVERNNMIQTAVTKNVIEPSKMSDEGFKVYFEKNPNKFKQPERVKLKLISTQSESKAKDALERLQRGDDFGDVAAALSEDDYRVKGGDIGYIHRGRVLQEIEDVAFSLKAGETSGLIKAEERWYVIRVDEKMPERNLNLDEAREKRKKEMEKQQAKELMDTWVARLRSKAKIDIILKLAGTADIIDRQTATNP